MAYRTLVPSLLLPLALAACNDGKDGGVVRQSGGAGFIDAEEKLVEFECECEGALQGAEAEAACFDDYAAALEEVDAIGACIDRALADHPSARDPFACMVDAQYDLVECAADIGCSTFSCADGSRIHDAWVCDGEPDCAGGEDEGQSCPAPHACGDGDVVPAAWVCDGYDDCGDGSDEPADCQLDCMDLAFLAFEECPPPPEDFMRQVDDCFPSVVVEECIGDDCASVPACEDGGCAYVPDSGAPRTGGATPRPGRTGSVLQAARHVIQPR